MRNRASFQALDDDALVSASAEGERLAFEVLVERWSPRVLAFLARALGSRDDAEDFTQETFVRVYRAASHYRADGRFAAWLFRIAGNLARQEFRRRKVRRFFLGAGPSEESDLLQSLPAARHFDPDGPLRDEQTRADIARALDRLPERQRLAILLRYFEELRMNDVAEALNISLRAAESLVARGTRTLREHLRRDLP